MAAPKWMILIRWVLRKNGECFAEGSIPQAAPVLGEVFHTGVNRGENDDSRHNAADESIGWENQPQDQPYHGAGSFDLAAPGGGYHLGLGLFFLV